MYKATKTILKSTRKVRVSPRRSRYRSSHSEETILADKKTLQSSQETLLRTEEKKFERHHSTLSQPAIQEIDLKNIEPSYFLDCDILKSIVEGTPVNSKSSTSHIKSLSNWMKLNKGHFYCSETTQNLAKKSLPNYIDLQKSKLTEHEKQKIVKELEFLLPVSENCILELIEASWIKSNALSSVRPPDTMASDLVKIPAIDTVVFLTKGERLFNYLISKQEIRQSVNEVLQKYKIEDLIRILPLSSLDLKGEVPMTE